MRLIPNIDYGVVAAAALARRGGPEELLESLAEEWATAYRSEIPQSSLLEFDSDESTFLFDLASEAGAAQADRSLAAWGRSRRPPRPRDRPYQRSYPLPKDLTARPLDKGHMVAHAAGGTFGPNMFPQDRDLNRGWSSEGRRYRALEREIAKTPGTFFFCCLLYADDTDFPAAIELGVLRPNGLHVERFRNRFDLIQHGTLHPDTFEYFLSIEDDRIRFRINTTLDDYLLQTSGRNGQTYRQQRALLTHVKGLGGFTQDEIEEMEELLNNKLTREHDFQRFFETHPHFFRKWDYREVHPHVYLAQGDTNLVPDFILTDRELHRAMILELKKADFKLTRRQRNRDRFTDAVMEARSQLLTYRDWFREASNRQMLVHAIGMEIYEPRLAVVIGRSSDFLGPLDRQMLESRTPDIEIVTYDDIRAYAVRRRILLDPPA